MRVIGETCIEFIQIIAKHFRRYFLLFCLVQYAPVNAKSVATYPVDWKNWPVVKEAQVFSNDVVLPNSASLFQQETVKAYNWVNGGEGSALTLRVNPNKLQEYRNHGPYSDGVTAIAVVESANIIWVTEHIAGYPIYGSYDFSGQDISTLHPSLDPEFCDSCHNTYKDICINGTCYTPK